MTTPTTYVDLPDPQTVPTAGLLPRLGAYLADQFVLIPLTYGTYYFLVQYQSMVMVGVVWLLQFAYKPLCENQFGRTPGKALLRLRVVDRGTNTYPGLNQSFVRYLPFAVANFVALFVLSRMMAAPGFEEIATVWDYTRFLADSPLRENTLIGIFNSLPVFSGVWLIMDPWNRALHDRWAQTFVVKEWAVDPRGQDQ